LNIESFTQIFFCGKNNDKREFRSQESEFRI
jgi:hypothetical protein